MNNLNLKKNIIALVTALVVATTPAAFADPTPPIPPAQGGSTNVSAPAPPAPSGGTVTNDRGVVTHVPQSQPTPAPTPYRIDATVYNNTTVKKTVVVQSGHLGRALDAIQGGLTGHKTSVRDLGHLLKYKGGEKLAGTNVPPGGLLVIGNKGKFVRNNGVSDAMLAEAIAKLDAHTGQAVREERAYVRNRLDTLNGDIQEVKGVQTIQTGQINQLKADIDGILQIDEAQNRAIKNHTERLNGLEEANESGQGTDTRQNWWLTLLTLALAGFIGFLFWRQRQPEEEQQPANLNPAPAQPQAPAPETAAAAAGA